MRDEFQHISALRERVDTFVDDNPDVVADLTGDWQEPEPLTRGHGEPAAYPVEALPGALAAAVQEVASYVQCPVAMAAASALTGLSVAGQGLADVHRDGTLHGPVSLFFLVLAESGERKTAVDKQFFGPIRTWEQQQEERRAPEVADYQADVIRWEAERAALQARITAARKDGKSTDALGGELREHQRSKPRAPMLPRSTYSDFTVEQLASQMSQRWPSGAIVSSEGGSLLGGPGASVERATYTLTRINELWDGGTVRIDRRTTDSLVLRGCRLSACVQVQPDVMRAFIDRTGRLARGSGFLARFLVAQPQSTQGQRRYREPPANTPNLSAFTARLIQLLDQTCINEDGQLVPARLSLSAAGKRAWIEAHDTIEAELAPTGELSSIRDVASKAAEQIARLAALLHIFERGADGSIGADHVEAAAQIVGWHLEEARRAFDTLDVPDDVRDAMRLSDWLRSKANVSGGIVPRRDAQRDGPIRDGDKLDVALDRLQRVHHIRQIRDGRRKLIEVNPELIGGAP